MVVRGALQRCTVTLLPPVIVLHAPHMMGLTYSYLTANLTAPQYHLNMHLGRGAVGTPQGVLSLVEPSVGALVGVIRWLLPSARMTIHILTFSPPVHGVGGLTFGVTP